jgi:hypothetical protein
MSDQSNHDRKLREAERAHDLVNDLGKRMTEAACRDAQEAIKVALLINGGAAVAILAFISTMGRNGFSLPDLRAVSNSLFYFAGGIVSAGITAAFAYLANGLYAGNFFEQEKYWVHPYVKENPRSKRMLWWARFFNWAGFILGWVALALFIAGVFVAARALSRLN